MTDLVTTFQNRFGDWTTALVEHLQISLLSLLLAIICAVPLAIFFSKNKRLAELALQVTGIFQTIPSLALLGLFIPFMGIGTLPAVVALVIYALFPIMQSTITALDSIDPSLIEAGTAFGMNRWERLKTFIIPISMPIIMAGIRTSAVMIIGTATLAALIGAGGLGSFIMLGIDRNNSSLILIGALSSAVLAVLINWLLKVLEKAKQRTILVTVSLMLVGLLGSYAPAILKTSGMASERLVIAGKLGAEPEILINMYQELIEQETDMTVELKPSFGKTSFLYEALKAGQIDIYPEFTGTVTGSLLTDPPQVSTDPEQVYEAAREGILAQDNLVMLKPMAYQNTYALAVTRAFADEHGLKTISDLTKVQDQLVAGFSLEFKDRADGYLGIQKLYGLDFTVNTMEPSLRYQAIQTGDVNLIDAYSTDSQLKQYDLVVLEDDRQLFPPYQGAPLLSQKLLNKHPELEKMLNQLAGKITAEEMSAMNYQVDVEGKSAKDVAHDYLVGEELVKE
ncbi:ABC transporter permease/substrate-binding protein [Streptococcus sp. S784/96/1]|uniref:ABC transporter permease/substrate-binding protein n=1 Tax=Streptococcus sp. S784/96/1 TaxID=2653499 RepID=UPI0013872355|nr:ABC transporter permease/substrate-binding protein [Streptococcus sp. S784/96/1]